MSYRVILLFIFYYSAYYTEGIYYLEGAFNIEITVIINLLQVLFSCMQKAPPDRECISFKIYHWFWCVY
jgi:hypothetical protein